MLHYCRFFIPGYANDVIAKCCAQCSTNMGKKTAKKNKGPGNFEDFSLRKADLGLSPDTLNISLLPQPLPKLHGFTLISR